MNTGKTRALTRWAFVGKVMSLLFNILSRFVIVFPPRSKGVLIPRLWSQSTVILEPKKTKSVTVPIVSPAICCEMIGPADMILGFWMSCFKPAFSLSSLTFIKRLFSSSLLSAVQFSSATESCLTLVTPRTVAYQTSLPITNSQSLLKLMPTEWVMPSNPWEWYHQCIWACWYFSQQFWFQLVSQPTWHFTWCTLHIS